MNEPFDKIQQQVAAAQADTMRMETDVAMLTFEELFAQWDTLPPQVRDGLVAETFDLVPHGCRRPFRMAESEAIWDVPGVGFQPVPSFTERWASCMKLVTKLQEQWWKAADQLRWTMRALEPGNWQAGIMMTNMDLMSPVEYRVPVFVAEAPELPLAVCTAALRYRGQLK